MNTAKWVRVGWQAIFSRSARSYLSFLQLVELCEMGSFPGKKFLHIVFPPS